MRIYLFNAILFFCYCHAVGEQSLISASILSYYLEMDPSVREEYEDLWLDIHDISDKDTLQLARYYFDEGNKDLSNQKIYHQEAAHLLNYLSNARGVYPHFENNVLINHAMHKRMKPHLLPINHPIKPILDSIIARRVTHNVETFTAAGFQILYNQETSFIKVASHPLLPGYLFKVYLDDEMRQKEDKPGWHWLCNRCEGADRIRRLIKKEKIRNFVVPDKWLYPLPAHDPSSPAPQPVILVVTDMNLTDHDQTINAWKTVVTKKHLHELYTILSHNMGSRFLSGNVPYTKEGKFAFIDTEYPKRRINLKKVLPYLSPKMQEYWENLIQP